MRNATLVLALFACTFVISGCSKNSENKTYTYQLVIPVYGSRAVLEEKIKAGEPRDLQNPGKIYVKGDYLLISEAYAGIHIFDNSDVTHPVNLSFIPIPGTADLAMVGDYLYADMYGDLVTLNIKDPKNSSLESVKRDVFSSRSISPIGSDSLVVVDVILKDTTVSYNPNEFPQLYFSNSLGQAAGASKDAGSGGSLARFTVLGNYLYTVDYSYLGAFDLSNPKIPKPKSFNEVGSNIETIFPFGNKLYIGSMRGMYVYDVSDPANPTKTGSVEHSFSCDPVVTDGQFAFVTLRVGRTCSEGDNRLEIYDIADAGHPTLIARQDMISPNGLGITNDRLFICEGEAGLKIFKRKGSDLTLLKHDKEITSLDVIPMDNDRLLLMANDGIKQVDYSNPNKIKILSTIKASNTGYYTGMAID